MGTERTEGNARRIQHTDLNGGQGRNRTTDTRFSVLQEFPAVPLTTSIRQPRVMSDLVKSARGLLLIIFAVYLVPNHGKRCWRTFIDRVASPAKSD